MSEEVNNRLGYIYKITNKINGKIYIGKRKSSEFDESYWGSGSKLKVALKEFGTNNFTREIIEWCSTNDILKERERYWIEKLHARDSDIGYNIKKGGEGDKQPIPEDVKAMKGNKIVGVQVPDFLLEPLEREAEYYGLSISALIRLILAQRYRDGAKLNDGEDA